MSHPEGPRLAPQAQPLPTLYTAAIVAVDFAPEDPEGTFLYLYRLAGIVHRLAATDGRLGPILRLQGEFLAARAGATWTARSVIVPDNVAAAVRACFAERPPRSTRDRVRVHLDFDLWAVRRAAAPLGYDIQADGRAYVPEPFSALVASALARPYPAAPEESAP